MRTENELDLFILQEVQWALQHSCPILQWWSGRDWRLSLHKKPYRDDKWEPGEGSFWFKKEIFTVKTLNHWNNTPRDAGGSPSLEVFKT